MEFTSVEVHKMSNIAADIGQVALGSIVVPFFLQQFTPLYAILGLVLACVAWAGSIYLARMANLLKNYEL